MRLLNVLVGGVPHLAVRDGADLYAVEGVGSVDELLARRLSPQGLARGRRLDDAEVRFLPAVLRPEKILCVGRNYRSHAEEVGAEVPPVPCLFAKFPSSLSGHDAVVSPPRRTAQLDYEGELAVVVGEGGRNIPEAQALAHVFGYTAANDLTARDLQRLTPEWLAGKAPDGFLPLGPELVTADEVPDPQDLVLRTRRNGEVVQESSTARMIFSVAHLIRYCSELFTLAPGDVLVTGTPEGVIAGRPEARWLAEGEVVEVEVEGLTTLRTVIGPPW